MEVASNSTNIIKVMKKHWYIISAIIFTALIISIIIQETKGDYFRLSTEEVFDLSLNKELFINDDAIAQLKTKPLIINLNNTEEGEGNIYSNKVKTISIKPSELLKRENRKHYKNNQTIILWSDDFKQATYAWVILSRKAYKNVVIYSNNSKQDFK